VSENETGRLAAHCGSVLDLSDVPDGGAYGYDDLALCVIDAVWSISVRYEAVRAVVARYIAYADAHLPRPNASAPARPLSVFVAAMEREGIEHFADVVFANRQRTSTKNGIPKAEAVYRFARALREAGVEQVVEVGERLRADGAFEQAIAAIPGQGSGVSLRYFYMLCGAHDLVKPDRMIFRFLAEALGRTPTVYEAQELLSAACQQLVQTYPNLTPRTLDNAIWQYQRQRDVSVPAAQTLPPPTTGAVGEPSVVRDIAPTVWGAPPLAPPSQVAETEDPAPAERYHVRIREIPNDERPRERLLHYGADALSTAELLAILLRTGTEQRSAVGLADYLLHHFNGLRGVAGATIEEMAQVHGIGPAKAAQIKAAIEFGRRLVAASPEERPKIRSPRDVYNLLGPTLRDERREHFVAVLLDTKGGVMRQRTVSVGDLSSSIVHPREVFAEAIRHSAASLIVAHNHPSGDPTPSPEDAAVTRRLVEAGELLGIEVLDHIVIGDNRWVSLKEKGLM
jgi:DNA repair protein RadC